MSSESSRTPTSDSSDRTSSKGSYRAVVCAECNRRKIKCDRKQPCNNCTRRGIEAQCIYPPAPAGRVDLHSLNSRLIQVEDALALLNSERSQRPFADRPPNVNLPSPSFTLPPASIPTKPTQSLPDFQHAHHRHAATPLQPPPSHSNPAQDAYALSLSLSIPARDLAAIWLDDLDLGVLWPLTPTPSNPASVATPGNLHSGVDFITLEASTEQTHPRPHQSQHQLHASSFLHSLIDSGSSKSGSTQPPLLSYPHQDSPTRSPPPPPPKFRSSTTHFAHLLPALHIYYPLPVVPPPSSAAASFSTSPLALGSSPRPSLPLSPSHLSASLPTSHHPGPAHWTPQITPALLALLPPVERCTRLLDAARGVFAVRPFPFAPCAGKDGAGRFFERCLALLSGGGFGGKEKRDRGRKERETTQDRSRAGRPGEGGQANQDTSEKPKDQESLAFFALLCAVLACGACCAAPPLSTSTLSPEQLTQGHGWGQGWAITPQRESPAFFFSLSQQAMGVWDTFVSASSSAEDEDRMEKERMEYLLACLTGLQYLALSGSLRAAVDRREEEGHGGDEERVVYSLLGKTVTAARSLGLERKTSTSGAGRKERGGVSDYQQEEWKRMVWWEVMFFDLFTSDILGRAPFLPAQAYTTRLRSYAPGGDEADKDSGEGYEYLGARHRLTQLAARIKDCIARPTCGCCGYTLEQAVELEGEVSAWAAGLPGSLRWPSSSASTEDGAAHDDLRGPVAASSDDKEKEKGRRADASARELQSAELALMAGVLILLVYRPFLRPSILGDGGGGSGSPANPASTPHPHVHVHTPASRQAARVIIRAANDIQTALESTTAPVPLLPTLLDFYALEKLVFDASVICAHAALLPGRPSLFGGVGGFAGESKSERGSVVEDAVLGLRLLSSWGAMTGAQERVVERLSQRLRGASAGTPTAGLGAGTKSVEGDAEGGGRLGRSQSLREREHSPGASSHPTTITEDSSLPVLYSLLPAGSTSTSVKASRSRLLSAGSAAAEVPSVQRSGFPDPGRMEEEDEDTVIGGRGHGPREVIENEGGDEVVEIEDWLEVSPPDIPEIPPDPIFHEIPLFPSTYFEQIPEKTPDQVEHDIQLFPVEHWIGGIPDSSDTGNTTIAVELVDET